MKNILFVQFLFHLLDPVSYFEILQVNLSRQFQELCELGVKIDIEHAEKLFSQYESIGEQMKEELLQKKDRLADDLQEYGQIFVEHFIIV